MNKLLVIGHVWPEPNTTAAGNRMLQLLKVFLKREYRVVFASTASKGTYSEALKNLGIEERDIALNDPSFDYFVQELQPQLVVFDRFMVEEQFGWRVAKNCPNAIRILNTEDVHSLREHRAFCFRKKLDWTVNQWKQQDKTKREMASIYRSDLTLLVSSFELELLHQELHLKEELLHLPFMMEAIDQDKVNHWPKFEERTDYISIGNGLHAPNVDSFLYLKEKIWPIIRAQQPSAVLRIYGAYLPEQVKQLHQPKTGFLVQGWVEDIAKEVQTARMMLAPLRFGAGIKGKLALAMENGTPNVTTDIGAEGMTVNAEWSGAVANGARDFAERAVQLYQNKEAWKQAQKNGIDIVNIGFNEASLSKMLFTKLEGLSKNLESHRQNNFVGALLQHQSMAATKYMGKWIEEKNKK